MNKLLLLLSVVFVAIAFTSCDKATENNGLTGTKWEGKFGEETLILHFVNDKTCTISSNRQGIFAANLEQYFYEPHDGVDGFRLYKKLANTTITHYIVHRVDRVTFKLSQIDPNGLIDYVSIILKKKN